MKNSRNQFIGSFYNVNKLRHTHCVSIMYRKNDEFRLKYFSAHAIRGGDYKIHSQLFQNYSKIKKTYYKNDEK